MIEPTNQGPRSIERLAPRRTRWTIERPLSHWIPSVNGVCLALLGVLIIAGAGCRITAPTPKGDEKVHDTGDFAANPQQIRLRMRALVEPFSGAIIESADRIMAGTTNHTVRREALRWKIEAVPTLRETLFRPNPLVAIMDTWVLTWQISDYFESGHGKAALGEAAPVALATCQHLEHQIETVVTAMTISRNLSDVREFARRWAREHPIRHSIASRESTLSRVTEREVAEAFSTTELVGSLAVSLDDLTRRLDVYSAQLLDQARWQAELFAMDQAEDYQLEKAMPLAETAVRSATEAVATLKRLEPAVDDTLSVAKTAPELISRERAAAIQAAQAEISRTLEFVQAERTAALEHLTKEREAALLELHRNITEEREALAQDMERISLKVVDHNILRVAQLTGVTLIALFVGIVALLFITRRLFSERQMKA